MFLTLAPGLWTRIFFWLKATKTPYLLNIIEHNGKSYKRYMIVNYDASVILTRNLPLVPTYDHWVFIRLAADLSSHLSSQLCLVLLIRVNICRRGWRGFCASVHLLETSLVEARAREIELLWVSLIGAN